MDADEPLLELRHVTFGYRREAVVEDVSLAIGRTDFIALLGPNGGGKTTLVKLMLGLLRPWSGEIVRRLPPGRGAIGYVPQFSTFERGFPLRVAEVVLMGRLGRRGLFRPYRREDREQVRRTLERLGLRRLARTHVSELSGGQLQRVLIARALAGEPAILLMDEPTASVDAESRASLGDLLTELAGRIPVLVVTHNEAGIGRQVTRTIVVDRRVISQDAAGGGHSHRAPPAGDPCG